MAKCLLFLFTFIVFHFSGYSASYTTFTIKDSVAKDTTWTCNQQYLLKGTVYVTTGNTLTIDSGTIIRGDKNTKGTLVIEQGAKLICNGTYQMPIIFTSNEAQGSRSFGDWGGIIICGKAPLNTNTSPLQFPILSIRSYYGGNIVSDNSGKLSYVRIEFAGAPLSPSNELNGLTLCGVGNGTQIDHIQVTMSGNDSYGWFGGTVNAKYLISHRAWDDDFETNQGYTGMVQYGVVLRDPYAADISGSVMFECNGFETRNPVNPTLLTAPVFSNITAVGPLVNTTSTAYDIQHIAAARWRRGAGMSILNSVLMAHVVGLCIQEPASYPSTVGKIGNYNTQFRNSIVAGMSTGNREILFNCDSALMACDTITGVNWNAITGFSGPWNWLKYSNYSNKLYPNATDVNLVRPFDLTSPNFMPATTSPVLTTITPDFTTNKANNSFFDKISYVGAFGTNNWTVGWTNFDPNNTFYDWCCGMNIVVKEQSFTDIESAILYPNPAKENTVLSINTGKATSLKITLTDMMGRIVSEVFDGKATEGQKEYSINLQNLSARVYNVVVSSDDERKNLKLIVQ